MIFQFGSLRDTRRVGSPRAPGAAAALLARYQIDLVVAFAAAAAVYGGFLFTPGFHLDDELSAYYGVINADVSLSRWGTALIRLGLIPPPFNGWFTSLLSLTLLSLAAVIFSAMFDCGLLGRRVAATIFLAFPQFAYELEFHVQADVIPLGYALALLSFASYEYSAEGPASVRLMLRAVSTLLAVLALSIYQPVVLVAIALCLFAALRRISRGDRLHAILRCVIGYAAVMAFVCSAYVVISRSLLAMTGLPNGSAYFTDQLAWGRQPTAEVFQTVLKLLAGAPSSTSYYGEGAYAYVLLPASLIVARSLRTTPLRCLISVLLVILLIAWPYLLVILLGTQQPGRTFVSQSFVFAGFWALAFDMLSRSKLRAAVPALAIAAATLFLLSGTFHASRLAFADDIAWRADISTGTRLASDIYRKYPDFNAQQHAVLFYGPYRREVFWHRANYDTFGRSFFEWDDGNTDRIDAFLTVSGIANFHPPAGADRPDLIRAARLLPRWPTPDAVAMLNGTIIVHLGE